MFYKNLFVLITFYYFQIEFIFGLNSSDTDNSTQNPLAHIVPEDDSQEYSFLITNGYRPLRPTLTKYVVSIRNKAYKYFGQSHICGGSIISPNVILTAAHCLCKYKTRTRLSPKQLIVVASTPKRLVSTSKTQVLRVRRIIRHMYYNPRTIRNDIGIIILASNVVEDNETAQRIALSNKTPEPDIKCTVVGWGRVIPDGPLPNEALYVDLTIFDKNKCNSYKNFAYGMLCAGDSEDHTKDACQGDSGGPMICNNILTGIVSFGRGCGTLAPGVYTDVSSFRKWISENDSNKLSPYITCMQAILLYTLLNYLYVCM